MKKPSGINRRSLVDRFINTSYDVVKSVADELDTIILLGPLAADGTLATAIEAANNVVLTNADVVLTNADVVLTGLDVIQTNADVITTGALVRQFEYGYLGPKATTPTLHNEGRALT